MKKLPIQKVPFVKILVPFVIGIVCRYKIDIPFLWIIPAALGGVFLLLFYLNKREKSAVSLFQARYYFGVGSCFVWMLIGILIFDAHDSRSTPAPDNQTPYLQIQLTSEHRYKNNHILFDAILLYGIKNDSCQNLQRQKVLLYFTQSDRVRQLSIGDILLMKNSLIPIKSAGNPDEFDYAEYMKTRHINYMQFLSDEWVFLGHYDRFSIKSFATKQKAKMRNIIEQSSLTEREQDFFKAVLLGITDDLSDEQRGLFQRAGLSHLLAISGLHVGILAFIILGLLYPIKKFGYNRVRFSVAILALWGYAFICGLSPSVVRACIMFSILMSAYLLKRHSYPVNSLAIAAFIMLLYDPFYLWDIGFQLSFLSVLLLLSMTALYNEKMSKNKVFNYIISLIWITTVVQIGTMALTIYYFHTIPIYSIICNLIMIPLFPIFLLGGILLILSGGCMDFYLSDILHFLFSQSNYIIRFIVDLPGATIENIWIDKIHVFFGLITIFFIVLWGYTRNGRYLITLLSVISAFLLLLFLHPAKSFSEISVYNHRGGISVNVIDYPQNYVITTDELFSMEEFEKAAQNHWMKINVLSPVLITDFFETDRLSVFLPFIQFGNKRILLLNDESWKYKVASTRLKIDLLIIGREYQERISDIIHLYEVEQVVISSDVNSIVASSFKKECDFLGLKCHDIAQDGAWLQNMDAF
ncbi:MAG: ComEC family competence protein [Bacteroidaceae bacterium]|nr:ComEC family competence protein [Bacteroidaceae bacterium]